MLTQSNPNNTINQNQLPYVYSICIAFLKKHKIEFAIYGFLLCIIAFERVAIPHVYGKLLNALRESNNKMYVLFGIIILIYCIFQFCETILTLLDAKLLPVFESYIRENVVTEIIDRHRQKYIELDLGNITSKLIKLPAYLRDAFYRSKAFFFNHILSVITTGLYLLYCHWSLGLIFIFAFVLLGISAWIFCNKCLKLSYYRESSFDNMQESIQDLLYNLLSVYTSRKEEKEKSNLNYLNNIVIKNTQNSIYCGIPFRIIFSIIFLLLFAGVTGTGIYLNQTKRLKIELLISSFIVTFAMLKTCMHFYYDFESFIYLQGGLKVVEDYLKQMPFDNKLENQNQNQNENVIPYITERGGVDIELKNVTFFYNKKKQSIPTLNNISLQIPAGQQIAIMGGIGSGKSSLGQLMAKLQCFQDGSILLNGTSITNISIENIRKSIHYVSQIPRLFNRTLLENLNYGNATVTPERVYAILKDLNLTELLYVFKKNMFNSVGKQGALLSGGQRQIVWLIRALFTPSDILILDEPTSALDNKSQKQIIQLIQYMIGNRTLILITHDTDLLHLVKRKVKLVNGNISTDTHTNLTYS